ncbi:hypothetical protein BVL52_11260 [Pseudomonas oryzihabitans]|uniref:DUF1652 domain-containing protein n=1 Tax=Pseudomonas oryzihabitans TaxID=47885 RepID=A0ABX3IRU5_9PSED|nr:hypothetical protein BVL52_11260 [Pseudomonas psychrotolerans]
MLPKYHARFSRYVADFFPECFRVEVTLTVDDNQVMVINVATPAGRLARCETTETQALDIMAMGEIALALQARVSVPEALT